MSRNPHRLLILDDEPRVSWQIREVAEKQGYDVRGTCHAQDFRKVLQQFDPTVLALDLKMPGVDIDDLGRDVAECDHLAAVLVTSGAEAAMQRLVHVGERSGKWRPQPLVVPLRLDEVKQRLQEAMGNGSGVREEDLLSAIHNSEILAYYQPKVDRQRTGRWISTEAEVLARWRAADGTLLMPAQFIPLAERSGLIGSLSEGLLQLSIRQLAAWRGRGLRLRLAVNIPAQLLIDRDFPSRVAQHLHAAGIDGESLTLEVTETVAMSDPELSMDILIQLREKNIRLAIDDFGMGYSSLRQLYELPFTELKVHTAFVRELTFSEEARVIVKATIDMAHALKMRVCAEGVENAESLALLEEYGCDTVQGFYFAAPVPSEEFERWTRQQLAS